MNHVLRIVKRNVAFATVSMLEKGAMASESNFVTKNRDIKRRDNLETVGDFHTESAWGKRTSAGALRCTYFLALKLICCHGVAQYVQLSRERKVVKRCFVILVTFYMDQGRAGNDQVRCSHGGKKIGITGVWE